MNSSNWAVACLLCVSPLSPAPGHPALPGDCTGWSLELPTLNTLWLWDSSGFEAEKLSPQSCLQHLWFLCSSPPPWMSTEINSRVPTAIISHMVALIFWIFTSCCLDWILWQDYDPIIESCAGVYYAAPNRNPLFSKPLLLSPAHSAAIVSSLVTMENSWEVGLLYRMW